MRGMVRIVWASLGGIVLAGCSASKPPATSAAVGEKRTVVTTVLTQAVPKEALGSEGRVLVVEYPPGVTSPAHRHPGAIFAYVAEGAVECGLDDGAVVRYDKGQAWYEKPGQLHRVARNASATEPAKLVVFFLTEPGAAVLKPEK